MPTDVSDSIRLLGEAFTVTRTAPAAMVNGYRVVGAQSTFTTSGVPYPLEGDELQRLPEGLRERGVRGLICDKQLQTVSAGDEEADCVAIDGDRYEVHRCQPWRAGNFFQVMLVLKP